MGQYIEGHIADTDYDRQKKMLELELESLIVPEVQATEEAGKLLQDLPRLWSLANLGEQRKLLVSMLDAVYIDTKNNLIVAVKPKPPFKPVFQVAASREGSDIRILNEPIEGSSLFLVETGESRTPHCQLPGLFSVVHCMSLTRPPVVFWNLVSNRPGVQPSFNLTLPSYYLSS